jgi:hypothetical protein
MVTVIFHLTDWEQHPGLDNPRSQMFQWLQNLKAFGVNKLVMIDETTFKVGTYYQHSDEEIEFELATDLNEYLNKLNTDQEIIVLSGENGSVTLKDFVHPKDAIYIVGPDFQAIEIKTTPDFKLTIQTKTSKLLYAHVALMIVINDRYIKTL